MPLVLSLAPGSDVFIDGKRYVVTEIERSVTLRLRAPDGEIIEVSRDRATKIAAAVDVRITPQSEIERSAPVRVAFLAPPDVPIDRGAVIRRGRR